MRTPVFRSQTKRLLFAVFAPLLCPRRGVQQHERLAHDLALPHFRDSFQLEKRARQDCNLFGPGPKGRTAPRCQARSKRTHQQCGAAAAPGRRACKWHGGRSTGPRTVEGRRRCALAKTVHGGETGHIRAERQAAMKRIAALVELGRMCGAFPPKHARYHRA